MNRYVAQIRNTKDRIVAEFIIPGADTEEEADKFASSIILMAKYRVQILRMEV